MKLYEGMIIVDDARCADDYDAVAQHVQEILTKNGAEVKRLSRWDDRRLAYPINRHTRGVYLLVHFDADPQSIVAINRDCQLSDVIVRALITVPMAVTIACIESGEELPEPVPVRSDRDGGDDRGPSRDRGERRDGPRRERRTEEKKPEAADSDKAAAETETAEALEEPGAE